MKILTKVLNVLIVILVISGIVFPIYHFKTMKAEKVNYELLIKKNNQLQYAQDANRKKIINLQTDIHLKDITIHERENTINSLRDDIDDIHSDYEQKIEELKDITLEEAIDIIINYYGYTIEDAEIITYNNEVRVVFKPSLVHEIPKTLVKLESVSEELYTYEKQVIEYDSLICDYIDKINLMEEKNSLLDSNYVMEKEKNSNLNEIIANRNKKIQSLKIQRNGAGVIIGIVIILALL